VLIESILIGFVLFVLLMGAIAVLGLLLTPHSHRGRPHIWVNPSPCGGKIDNPFDKVPVYDKDGHLLGKEEWDELKMQNRH